MAHALSGSLGGSRDSPKLQRPWIKALFVAIGLAAVALIVLWAWDRGLITRWKETATPLPYFAGMAIAPAFGIPMTPLFVLAGATFGRRVGLIGSGLALAANLVFCYWIARTGLRRWIGRLLRRFDYELPDFDKKYQGAWRFTFFVKLAPGIPQFVKNYTLGVAGVPFALYFGSSLLISGAYGAALILLGESLFQHDSSRSVVIGAAVVAVAVAVWWWRKQKRST